MKSKKVLITGSAGAIGKHCIKELRAHGHFVRGLDMRPTPEANESVIGDIADAETVDRAVSGMDAVIHLAAKPDDADFMTELLKPNVIGLYLICDAARRHKVSRLVLTSSIQAVWGQMRAGVAPIRVGHGPSPINHYALTKVLAEQMGDMYAQIYGMSVIVARVGFMVRNVKESQYMSSTKWGSLAYLSGQDCATFYRLCVESDRPEPGRCALLFATSKSTHHTVYDLADAKEVIGYEPQHTWPQGAPTE